MKLWMRRRVILQGKRRRRRIHLSISMVPRAPRCDREGRVRGTGMVGGGWGGYKVKEEGGRHCVW